jgi:hypothetical protein
MPKFYVQNGDFKKIYTAVDRESAAMLIMVEMVADGKDLSPFIMTSEQGFMSDIVEVIGEVTDELQIALAYNVIRAIANEAELVEAGSEEHEAWLELATEYEVFTKEFEGGENYKEMLADLV